VLGLGKIRSKTDLNGLVEHVYTGQSRTALAGNLRKSCTFQCLGFAKLTAFPLSNILASFSEKLRTEPVIGFGRFA
jgi:hypothetical protein